MYTYSCRKAIFLSTKSRFILVFLSNLSLRSSRWLIAAVYERSIKMIEQKREQKYREINKIAIGVEFPLKKNFQFFVPN